jgi:arsenate reductase (thioredoxin)
MKQETFNVLFLCTGNSARSIMGEAILNFLGRPKFKAFSAGSHPVGKVNPMALALLEKNRLPTTGLRSKDWSEFSQPGAPFLHFVFTVCDQAAAEPCPVCPGQPMTAHWGVHDPAAVQGSDEDKRRAFLKAYTELQRKRSERRCCLRSWSDPGSWASGSRKETRLSRYWRMRLPLEPDSIH